MAAAAVPFDEAEFFGNIGGSRWGDPHYTVRELTTLRPTIELNGLWGGYTGAGSKTVLPAEAHAKITMRLAPGMAPDKASAALQTHLRAHLPAGVSLEISPEIGGTPANSLPEDHPMLRAALAVLQQVHGQPAFPARAGGSIPITSIFKELLGMEAMTFGLAMPDEDVHAPNEFFRLSSFDEGLKTWPMLLTELGKFSARDFQNKAKA